jgi:oleate hydratase
MAFHDKTLPTRDPKRTQAWLVGSGIASLSAAVHLINYANVPGPNIHILDVQSGSGGGMNPYGNPQSGYFLPFDCHPHFHGSCMEALLSLVPSQTQPGKSMMDAIRTFKQFERTPPKDLAVTRALRQTELGPVLLYTNEIDIGAKNRMALIVMLLGNEKSLGSKTIEDVLDKSFFKTTFWVLWATS